MAENKLEGFDDLLPEGQGGAGGELDDLLGSDAGGGGGESELDSFFEDLSTIDDLEVMQEEKPKAAAVQAPAAQKVAPAPKPEKPKKEKAKKAPKVRGPPGRFMQFVKRTVKRLFVIALIAAVFGGGGYYVYTNYIVGTEELPWQTAGSKLGGVKPVWDRALAFAKQAWTATEVFWNKKIKPNIPGMKEISSKLPAWEAITKTAQAWWEKGTAMIPSFKTDSFFPKKPAVAPAPPPKPPPLVLRPVEPEMIEPPRPQRGPWYGIQVATCFFDSCVAEVREVLRAHRLGGIVMKERGGRKDVLEVISHTVFTDRAAAADLVARINQENRMEGSAHVLDVKGGHRISMGAFPDLDRAGAVKDNLNQRYHGEVIFAHQLKTVPYKVRTIVAGRYPTRLDAERVLSGLRLAEPGLDAAAVVQR